MHPHPGGMPERRTHSRPHPLYPNAATPAGVVFPVPAFRGCRSAQPPANRCHPIRDEDAPSSPNPESGHPRCRTGFVKTTAMPLPEPGGFPAISRWLRSNATTPPVMTRNAPASRRDARPPPIHLPSITTQRWDPAGANPGGGGRVLRPGTVRAPNHPLRPVHP